MVAKSGTYVSYHYSQVKPDITDMFGIVPFTLHHICYTLTGILISSYIPFRVFHYPTWGTIPFTVILYVPYMVCLSFRGFYIWGKLGNK